MDQRGAESSIQFRPIPIIALVTRQKQAPSPASSDLHFRCVEDSGKAKFCDDAILVDDYIYVVLFRLKSDRFTEEARTCYEKGIDVCCVGS